MAVVLFVLGIKSPSSFACAGGSLSAMTLNAIVMAGEDRGAGKLQRHAIVFYSAWDSSGF